MKSWLFLYVYIFNLSYTKLWSSLPKCLLRKSPWVKVISVTFISSDMQWALAISRTLWAVIIKFYTGAQYSWWLCLWCYRAGVRCTPLLITVKRRIDLLADVTDEGFMPDIIYIDQGHSIKWQWKNCTSPHSIQEVRYDMSKACFKRDTDSTG